MPRKPSKPSKARKAATPKPGRKGKSAKSNSPAEQERIQKAGELFLQAMDGYLELHPNLEIETLLWITEFAFKQLRHSLDVEPIPGLTWQSPMLGFNWPIPWNWDRWKEGGTAPHVHCEAFSAENTRTPALVRKTICKTMVSLTTVTSLHLLTHFVGVEKRGSRYTPILSPQASEAIANVRGSKKKKALFESFFHPFSMGAGSIEFDESELKPGGRLSKKLTDQLTSLHERIDLPPIVLHANKDGLKMEFLLCFQIHPFVVDVPKRQAYFPLTVGFIIQPEMAEHDDPLAILDDRRFDPSTWSRRDRDRLWKAVFQGFKDLQESWGIKPNKEVREAIIEVTAKVKVTLQPGEENPAARVMKNMLQSFERTGEIIQADIRPCSLADPTTTRMRQELSMLLDRVETETSANQKGEALEALVSKLLESINGFEIGNRQRTATEEIDVVVLNKSNHPCWRNEGSLILFECKNWTSSCGKNELVLFDAKIRNRRNRGRLGFLISWNGFASTLKAEQLRGSREDIVIGLLDGDQIREAVRTGDFLPILERSWNAAVLT